MAEEDNISGQEELQSQVDPSLQRIRDYQKTGPGVGDIVIVVTYTAMSLGKCQDHLNQWTSSLSDSDFILVGSVLNCYVLIAGWKNSRRLARYEVLNTLSFSKLQTSMLFMILLVDSLLIASSQVCAGPLELI